MADKTTAKPGWYRDATKPGQDRRWDGEKWLDEWRDAPVDDGMGPGLLLLMAFVIAVVAGVIGWALAESDDDVVFRIGLGIWAVGGTVAGLMAQVAVTAMGVDLGMRKFHSR